MSIMKKNNHTYIFIAVVCTMAVSTFSILYKNNKTEGFPATKTRSSYSPKASQATSFGRDDFFFKALRDPQTNIIPKGIRTKEAQLFNQLKAVQLKSTLANQYTWAEAGPNDVGGRTRALAIDVTNSNHIIAGGVSGGVWTSNDKGQSWTLRSTQAESFAVNSICQDTRVGHQNTWYYVGGEFTGNSVDTQGAYYTGSGLHRSTDNGVSWQAIIDDSNPFVYNLALDYSSKILVDPTNGTIYIACHNYGILKVIENNGIYSLETVFGGINDHYYSDFDIDSNGNMIACISQAGANSSKENTPGIYYRPAGTSTFTKIEMEASDPNGFPTLFDRSVIQIAPSDPSLAYVYTVNGDTPYFHEIHINQSIVSNSYMTNRTSKLPSYGALGSQGAYNMTLAVKPDDPDFVIIGSTSLIRSNNAFATTPIMDYGWIGGYAPDGTNIQMYPNHHPDCHITVFDPSAPDEVWSGHDGGLSHLADVTASYTIPELLPWEDMNNGYNVTQFYTLATPMMANENRYIGGTQDNGSPYFKTSSASSIDISSGDGAYCYLGANYAYVSSQNGNILRTAYDTNGDPLNPFSQTGPWDWSQITPTDATGQLFINPFVMDPLGDTTMYYAGGIQLWINLNVEDIPIYTAGSTMQGWYAPTNLDVPGELISALNVSKVPSHVLYYATYTGSYPKLYKVNNAVADEPEINREAITMTAASQGSFPYYIAINAYDANEIIVVFANYGVPSLFYSNNGGASFSIIDGNLTATPSLPGPSIRSAAISNWNGIKTYYISTSIGVYQTTALNGASTQWVNVDADNLGNVVCNRVKASEYDGKVVIATHGRGIFTGTSDNNLWVNEKLPNLNRLTSSPNDNIDISTVFAHQLGGDITLSLASNSAPEVTNASVLGNTLTLNYTNSVEGTSLITLAGESGTDVAQFTFAVSVSTNPSTQIEEVKTEMTNSDFSIYPNPTKGSFKITMPATINEVNEVKIYNMAGKLVMSHSFANATETAAFDFNISELSKGYYLVMISSEGKIEKTKILKE